MTHNCPIILIFEYHADMNITHEGMRFILPSLKKMGFKTIAVEQPSNYNQDYILNNYQKTNPTYLLTKKAIKEGFTVESIDLANRDSLETNLQKIKPKIESLVKKHNYNFEAAYSDKLAAKLFNQDLLNSPNIITRNKNFVQKIDEICKNTDAGILGNFGIYHNTIIADLKNLGYEPHAFFIRGQELPQRFQQGVLIYNKEVAKEFLSSVEEIKIADFAGSTNLYNYLDSRVNEIYDMRFEF